MPGISDFVSMATTKLGISQGSAEAGAGGLLEFVKKQVGGSLFGEVSQVLPDAEKVAAKAPTPVGATAEAGTGLGAVVGGLAKKAGSLLGGSGGQAAGVLSMLKGAGIGADKAPGFASLFVEFLKSKLSPDLFGKVISKIGALKGLAPK